MYIEVGLCCVNVRHPEVGVTVDLVVVGQLDQEVEAGSLAYAENEGVLRPGRTAPRLALGLHR